jgi:hypothetical protein
MTSARFGAIFLDSNICLPAWPDEPVGLTELTAIAGLLSIPILLPGPVDLELREHCLRTAKQQLDDIMKSRSNLAAFVRERVEVTNPSSEMIGSDYERRATQTKKALGLDVSPFPKASLIELFTDAIQQSFPFENEGKNFQDAVILRSVCEVCIEKKIYAAAFVSKNKQDFKTAAVKRFGEAHGLSLTLLCGVAEVYEALWPSLEHLLKLAWEKDKEVAARKLNDMNSDIESFLRSRFVKTNDVELHLLSLNNVITGFPIRIKTPTEKRTPITFDANVQFRGPGESLIERGITVESWANYEDGAYGPITLESAEITR